MSIKRDDVTCTLMAHIFRTFAVWVPYAPDLRVGFRGRGRGSPPARFCLRFFRHPVARFGGDTMLMG